MNFHKGHAEAFRLQCRSALLRSSDDAIVHVGLHLGSFPLVGVDVQHHVLACRERNTAARVHHIAV